MKSTDNVIEELRVEVAKLREEIAGLRADRTVHHYHHQAQPAPFVGSPSSIPHWPGYYPATSGGAAISMGMSEGGIG